MGVGGLDRSMGVAHVAPRRCRTDPQRPTNRHYCCYEKKRGVPGTAHCGEGGSTQSSVLGPLVVSVGVPGVSERGGEPPGPIPNPVVPTASAGRVLGGRPPGKRGPRARHPPAHQLSLARPSPSLSRRGVEQRQLVGLITQRSWVRIPPPLPITSKCRRKRYQRWWRFCLP
jgi:hypothetical protein